MVPRADLDRHLEPRHVRLPPVGHRPAGVGEPQFEHGNRRVLQILVEDRRQAPARPAAEELHDVGRRDGCVLEPVEERAHHPPPPLVIVDDGSQRVDEERAFEIHVLGRDPVHAAPGDDGLPVPDLALVPIEVGERVGLAEGVLDVDPLGIRAPGLVNPLVAHVARGDRVAEPLVGALVHDDEVELRADADAGPVALQVAVGEAVAVRHRALVLHA